LLLLLLLSRAPAVLSFSYNILNPNITKKYIDDLKKGAEELLIDVKLDAQLYRMGHTKAGLPSLRLE